MRVKRTAAADGESIAVDVVGGGEVWLTVVEDERGLLELLVDDGEGNSAAVLLECPQQAHGVAAAVLTLAVGR